MESQAKQQTDFIKMVANRLAKNFMAPLFQLTKEKSYSAHIGGLAEILDWSQEFCDHYFTEITNREMFRDNGNNIYNACTIDDLIISFGREKLQKFYAQNESNTNYFKEKYLTI